MQVICDLTSKKCISHHSFHLMMPNNSISITPTTLNSSNPFADMLCDITCSITHYKILSTCLPEQSKPAHDISIAKLISYLTSFARRTCQLKQQYRQEKNHRKKYFSPPPLQPSITSHLLHAKLIS